MSFKSIIKKVIDFVEGDKTLSWSDKTVLVKKFSDEKETLKPFNDILVGSDQCVACYSSNRFSNLLRTGVHSLPDDVDKVFFIDTSVYREKFGLRAPKHPITIDKKSFGCSGYVSFKIIDENVAVGNFINKIYSHMEYGNPKEVMRWLRDGVLLTAFQDIVKDQTCDDFLNKEKDGVVFEFESRIGYELMDYGLELVSLDIQNFSKPRQF